MERSSRKIEHTDFIKLYDITKKQPWLEYESEALLELWNICDLGSEQDLILNLLERIKYLNSRDVDQQCKEIAKKIIFDWNLKPENTYLVATSKNSDADGSQSLLQLLKNKFAPNTGWTEKNFINSLPIGAYKIINNDNIILIDDFIGTGDTIIRKIEWVRKKLFQRGINQYNLMICALAAMEFSISKLDTMDAKYCIPLFLKKGISDFYDGADLSSAIINMTNLEDKLNRKYKKLNIIDYYFGYKRSETLFAMESYNIPNNVFPIFWWPVLKKASIRKTIFQRLS